MNSKALDALHALVQNGGIAAAAKRLHRTEAQVSRLLSQLKEDAGFALLRKDGRRLALTDDGWSFYRRMLPVLETKHALEQFARDTRLKRAGRIYLTAANHMIDGFVVDAIIKAHTLRPQLSFTLNTRMPLSPQSTLGGDAFDMVLAQLPIDHPSLVAAELARMDMVLAVPSGHRLASMSVVGVEDIVGEVLTSLPSRSIFRGRLEPILSGMENPPEQQFEASFASTTCQLVAGGCGVAIVDPLVALAHRHLGLVLRRFEPAVTLRYGVAYPENAALSEAGRFFEEQLRDVLRAKVQMLDAALA
ncbi:MAG: hypothetical protein JWP47_2043 [Polaromonas sp.]|jgi:DNA-binding transcriptional LysR family regulator|nr:hypothetical protein [Polaromonas sp.]